MIQRDAEFAAASLDGYERIIEAGNHIKIGGPESYRRGVACGLMAGFVALLARETSRDCAHQALRHALADCGGVRKERPVRDSAAFIFAIWISGAALGAMLAGVVAVIAR